MLHGQLYGDLVPGIGIVDTDTVTTAGDLGACLLLGHGIAVVEASIPALVSRAHDMRMNAVIQQMALSLGGRVSYLEGSPPSANIPNPAAWEYWKQLVSKN